MEKVWETSYDSILGQVVKMNKKVPVRINYTLGKRAEKNIELSDSNLIDSIDYKRIRHIQLINLLMVIIHLSQ